MQKRSISVFLFLILAIIIGGIIYQKSSQKSGDDVTTSKTKVSEYNPVIDPDNFVSQVDNPYFTLKLGTKFIYENKTAESLERIEVVITHETKKVLSVITTVVWDRVWLDNQLVEDTKDWYAQDKEGNVWYFGEEVANFEDGKLKDHKGAWEAGVDGALPGIIMPADPQVGHSYRQEYYIGVAEDMGEIAALSKKVTVPYGTFANCLQTRDWSAIDKSANEYKYYCPDVGFVVLEEQVADNKDRVELVRVSIAK